MKKSTKSKAKVKTLFSPTAITNHLSARVREVAYGAERRTFSFDDDPRIHALKQRYRNLYREEQRINKELRDKARAFNGRLDALRDKTIDKIVLGQLPANLGVVKDFKRQVADLR